jgi:hypothetical protein
MQRSTVVVVLFSVGSGFYMLISDPIIAQWAFVQPQIAIIFIVVGVLYYLIVD